MGGLGGMTWREAAKCCVASLVLLLIVTAPMAALRAAAGGAKGTGGFRHVESAADRIFSDVMPVALAVAPFALLVGGVKHFWGDDDAHKWLWGTAIGVVLVLSAKPIAS